MEGEKGEQQQEQDKAKSKEHKPYVMWTSGGGALIVFKEPE